MNQELFNYFSEQHGVTLVESDLQEVQRLVLKSLIKPVDKDNLSTKEVIAFNEVRAMVGTLDSSSKYVYCYHEEERILTNITHYMEVPDIKQLLQ